MSKRNYRTIDALFVSIIQLHHWKKKQQISPVHYTFLLRISRTLIANSQKWTNVVLDLIENSHFKLVPQLFLKKEKWVWVKPKTTCFVGKISFTLKRTLVPIPRTNYLNNFLFIIPDVGKNAISRPGMHIQV